MKRPANVVAVPPGFDPSSVVLTFRVPNELDGQRLDRFVHWRIPRLTRARAEEMKAEGRPGAARLVMLLDDPARYLNTALLLRLLCEISAIVLVATWAQDAYAGDLLAALTTIGVMLVVSFVVLGVAPRTLGRQHDARIALLSAGPLSLVTTILGPIPALLILRYAVIAKEERYLRRLFGTEYDDYCRRVRRWL